MEVRRVKSGCRGVRRSAKANCAQWDLPEFGFSLTVKVQLTSRTPGLCHDHGTGNSKRYEILTKWLISPLLTVSHQASRALIGQPWRRYQSDDIHVLQQTIQNSVKQTQAISAQFNAIASSPVQAINAETGRKEEAGPLEVGASNALASEYYELKKRRTTSPFSR